MRQSYPVEVAMSSTYDPIESASPVEEEEMEEHQDPAARLDEIPITWSEIYADDRFMAGFPGGPEAVPNKIVEAILDDPQKVRRVMIERLRKYRVRLEEEASMPPPPVKASSRDEET